MTNKDIYLVAFYSVKPKPRVQTQIKGWMDDPDNVQWDERVEITRGTKKNAIDAKIVINLSNKTVQKNGWGDNKSFEDLFKYFFTGYHQYITEVMTQIDPEFLAKIVAEMEQELEQAEKNEETQAQ